MFGAENTVYYKYTLSKVEIMIPGMDNITVDHLNIGGIIIEKDFDNDIHPVLELKLSLRPIDIYNILDNKNTVRFNVRLDKFAYSTENDAYLFKDISFNEIFAIYIDDNTAQLDKELYEKSQIVKGTDVDISDIREVYDFFLFKEKDIEASRKMINAIISHGTMTDAATYLLSTAGCDKVLMSPIDNGNEYDEILLQPVTLVKNIEVLNKDYGFYKHGLTLFFDIPRTYFIDKRGRNTVYARGEYTNVMVYIYKASNPYTVSGGFEKNAKTKSYGINLVTSSINMKTSGSIYNETTGTDVIIVDSMHDNVERVSPTLEHRGSTTSRVVDRYDIVDHENEFVADELNARISEQTSIFEVEFTGLDIDILTPNKRFTFVFEDMEIQKRVGGVYRLVETVCGLSPKGHELNSTATCIFYKID